MFSTSWRRQTEPSNPEIWDRFEKTNKDGQLLKFRTQTMTDEYVDEVLDMMCNNFMPDETLHYSTGAYKCDAYKQLLGEMVKEVMVPHNTSIICVLDEDKEKPRLVGFNLLAVCTEGADIDLSDFMNIEAAVRVITFWFETKKRFPDAHELYGVKDYLGSLALCIHPDFRGMNIAKDVLLSRVPLCKSIGLKLTSSTFTGVASQVIALKAGFKEDGSVIYADLEETLGFKIITKSKYCKSMSLQID